MTIELPITDGANTVAGKLTGKTVKEMQNIEAKLVVKTESASYELPAEQINIDKVAEYFGAKVALSDIDVTVEISEPAQGTSSVVENAAKDGGYSLVVPAVDFTISCEYNGKTLVVTNFNSYVERLIKIPDGVDHKKISTGVVVGLDGSTYHVPTKIIVKDNVYYAEINSLTNSIYTLIWHPVEFDDIQNHWAEASISNMGSRMVLFGMGNDDFCPNRYMTRAEFAATIVRALGLEPENGSSSFGDVKSDDWFAGYAETAVSYGIINGYPDGDFRPEETITREQAMTMIARAMKLTGLSSELAEGEASTLLNAYNDAQNVSAYAEDGIAACIKTGVVIGRTTEAIAPQNSITRAEVAVMAERLLHISNLI